MAEAAALLRLALASCSVCATMVLYAPAAQATDCSGTYSPCINPDTLWPHAGPARFVAVGSTETVAPGQIGLGLVTSYLSQPIILHNAGTEQYAVDNQVNGTFLGAYGVTDRLELDLAVPLTFFQSGAGLSPVTGGDGLKDVAVRDMRFGLAYAILPHARTTPDVGPEAWGVAARLEVSAPTGDTDQLAGEGAGVFVPSLSADWRTGGLFAGAEVGGRLRPTSNLLGSRVGPQLVTALGLGYDILPHQLLTAVLEGWALPTFAEQDNGQTIVPAEWQLSARTAPLRGGDFSVQLGGGGELPLTNGALTMPRFRFTLGLRWAPSGRPVSSSPARDICTTDPTVVGGADGCPDDN